METLSALAGWIIFSIIVYVRRVNGLKKEIAELEQRNDTLINNIQIVARKSMAATDTIYAERKKHREDMTKLLLGGRPQKHRADISGARIVW